MCPLNRRSNVAKLPIHCLSRPSGIIPSRYPEITRDTPRSYGILPTKLNRSAGAQPHFLHRQKTDCNCVSTHNRHVDRRHLLGRCQCSRESHKENIKCNRARDKDFTRETRLNATLSGFQRARYAPQCVSQYRCHFESFSRRRPCVGSCIRTALLIDFTFSVSLA